MLTSLATLVAIVAAGAVSFIAMHLGDDWVAVQQERPGTGAIADTVLSFVPTIVFVVVLAALDAAWSAAAPLLTQWENHETQGKHRWALVSKVRTRHVTFFFGILLLRKNKKALVPRVDHVVITS